MVAEMLSMLLVFAHLLAASMALGAIVATDLRLLSKLAQDRTRIAPPNEFVARIVVVALLVLYATGAAIVWQGVLERPDYLANPKLQAKLAAGRAADDQAFVLHRLTFPRLARGRRVARWHATDWIAIGVPVGVSNFLWMFVAFLGVARAWNDTMPFADILAIAAILYVVAQVRRVRDPGGGRERRRSDRRIRARPSCVAGSPRSATSADRCARRGRSSASLRHETRLRATFATVPRRRAIADPPRRRRARAPRLSRCAAGAP